jgi:hypothetical protein
MLTLASNSRLESLIEHDTNLISSYYLIKNKVAEIIKWKPPPDPSVAEMPPYYSDHGVEHSLRILRILDRLTEKVDLKPFEICRCYARCGCMTLECSLDARQEKHMK